MKQQINIWNERKILIKGKRDTLNNFFNKMLFKNEYNIEEYQHKKDILKRELTPEEKLLLLNDWIYSETGKEPLIKIEYQDQGWIDLDVKWMEIDI